MNDRPAIWNYVVEPGVRLNVHDWGQQGETVALLIHGSADHSLIWADFAPTLARHCNVKAIDLRGHGDSDHDLNRQYTFAKHARDVRAFVDDLEARNLILIGHSLGGDIAVHIAADLGERLRALIVVDTGPGVDEQASEFIQDHLRQSHRTYVSVEEYAHWLRENRFFAEPAVLDRLAENSLSLMPDGRYALKCDPAVIDMITAELDDSWWLPALRRVTAPVLIVRGYASASLSKATAEMVSMAARNGKLVTVSGAGHAVINDNVDGFAQAVIPFIAHVLSTTAANTH